MLLIQIVWYNHRTSPQHLTLLAVHIVGAVLLSTGGEFKFKFRLSLDTLGDLLLFVAVVGNALLYIPTQRSSKVWARCMQLGFAKE